MQRIELRLECLKLCYRPDREPAKIVQVAKQFEEYLLEQATEAQPETRGQDKRGPGRPAKKQTGTPDILS